jgi:hypothetical protein
MMLHWHWVAMLISYLSSRVVVMPFNSINEMVHRSGVKLYVLPGGAMEDSFKLSTDPDWQKAWNEKIEPTLEEYKHFKGILKKVIEFAMERDPTLAIYYHFFGVR